MRAECGPVEDSLLGFIDPDSWRELLATEKQRRGVADSKLVFVGARNLARIAWCPMQAIRTSRQQEASLFAVYLEDRLRLALDTGRLRSLPVVRARWLQIAATEMPLTTVESLLLPHLPERLDQFTEYLEVEEGERRWAEPLAPSMRWHMAADGYVIIAAPDGLSRTQVLEAKSSRTEYLAQHQRPVAELQADVYGFLFERSAKVICETVGDGPFLLEESPVRRDRAIKCLQEFARLESGWIPSAPREAWKCRRCDVENGCPISRARER